MNQQELRAKIDAFKRMVASEPPQPKSDEQFQDFFAVGADILGELLIDIKRIADAAETNTYDKIDPALNV